MGDDRGADALARNEAPAPDAFSPPVLDAFQAISFSKLVHGIVHTQLVFVAARLRLADHLVAGLQTAADLAAATGTIEARLYRILRALASIGLVSETQPGCFVLTQLGTALRSDIPESQRDFAIMMGSPWHVAGWGNILHALQHEQSGFDGAFGMGLFDYLEVHPEESTHFSNAMTYTSRRHVDAILRAYDFAAGSVVVDVGGGHGLLLRAILKRDEGSRGILFDAPSVVSGAAGEIEADGLAARCERIGGSFFEAVPSGGDVYLLKYIIHDWDDAAAITILENCRKAMKPGARLLIIDVVVPVQNAPFAKVWSDIEMMVLLPNGKERTESEFLTLLSDAGLKIARIIPTRSQLSIIEAVPSLET